MNNKFHIGDLVADGSSTKLAHASQGVLIEVGQPGWSDQNISMVHWIKHEEMNENNNVWKIFTNELILLAKGKQNV